MFNKKKISEVQNKISLKTSETKKIDSFNQNALSNAFTFDVLKLVSKRIEPKTTKLIDNCGVCLSNLQPQNQKHLFVRKENKSHSLKTTVKKQIENNNSILDSYLFKQDSLLLQQNQKQPLNQKRYQQTQQKPKLKLQIISQVYDLQICEGLQNSKLKSAQKFVNKKFNTFQENQICQIIKSWVRYTLNFEKSKQFKSLQLPYQHLVELTVLKDKISQKFQKHKKIFQKQERPTQSMGTTKWEYSNILQKSQNQLQISFEGQTNIYQLNRMKKRDKTEQQKIIINSQNPLLSKNEELYRFLLIQSASLQKVYCRQEDFFNLSIDQIDV